jgi:hypothetical protein
MSLLTWDGASKGMTFDHDFYVVVGEKFGRENSYAGEQQKLFL